MVPSRVRELTAIFAFANPRMKRALRNERDVLDALDHVAKPFGLAVYAAWQMPVNDVPPGSFREGVNVFFGSTVKAEFRKEFWPLYAKNGVSILARSARLNHGPETWSEAIRRLQPTAAERWFVDLAHKHGMRDGLDCPQGDVLIRFYSPKILRGFETESRAMLNSGAQIAASRLREMMLRKAGGGGGQALARRALGADMVLARRGTRGHCQAARQEREHRQQSARPGADQARGQDSGACGAHRHRPDPRPLDGDDDRHRGFLRGVLPPNDEAHRAHRVASSPRPGGLGGRSCRFLFRLNLCRLALGPGRPDGRRWGGRGILVGDEDAAANGLAYFGHGDFLPVLMTRPGPSAICLECWRETGRPSDPLGYYDVPCLRHYDPKDADKPVRPITRADIGKDRREL